MEGLKKESQKFQAKLAAEKAKREAEERENQRNRKQNKWSGLIHHPNGKREFFDTREEVGGVNDWTQVHQHRGHHKSW